MDSTDESYLLTFGAVVACNPISARDESRLHQFGKKVSPGIFLGYELIAGGFCKGDILIRKIFEQLDASEIYPRRINVKEVLITQKKEMSSYSR